MPIWVAGVLTRLLTGLVAVVRIAVCRVGGFRLRARQRRERFGLIVQADVRVTV